MEASTTLPGRYVGAILHRGHKGFEAFDDRERSLGTFLTRDMALSALQFNPVREGRQDA
jgi:hypothetical protein